MEMFLEQFSVSHMNFVQKKSPKSIVYHGNIMDKIFGNKSPEA